MDSYELTRIIFLKALAFVYFFAFLNIVNQFIGLLGKNGLLPVGDFIKRIHWKRSPSLFWFNYSDVVLKLGGWFGLILALAAFIGLTEKLGYFGHFLAWGLLWVLYLSYVNIGQIFYGFGWESLLLETGFLAIFFPPDGIQTPLILIWLARWALFRVMFGAGLIKIRADKCWWDLTCMDYHYETQPMPNPLSWYFHRLPKAFHRASVMFTHFVELIVPWGLLFPGIIGVISGFLTALFQFFLILSGNLSWLNYITLVLCIPCFGDSFWKAFFIPEVVVESPSYIYLVFVYAYALFVAYRSWEPVKNLVSRHQMMNASFDPLHLVNTYGAFGSVTKRRFEIIFEGTNGDPSSVDCEWKEYEFKGKPGNPLYRPPIVAPYHMRLDWLMWFAAMGSYHNHPWTLRLVNKMLENEMEVLTLLKYNPFSKGAPKFIRGELYVYNFTKWDSNKAWWTRKRVGTYLPPLSLNDASLKEYYNTLRWL